MARYRQFDTSNDVTLVCLLLRRANDRGPMAAREASYTAGRIIAAGIRARVHDGWRVRRGCRTGREERKTPERRRPPRVTWRCARRRWFLGEVSGDHEAP